MPIHYNDEVVVPDFAVSGSNYFVVPKKDIGQILEYLPLDEAGKQKKQKIWEKEQYDKYAPKSISEKLGQYFWHEARFPFDGEYEFVKVSQDWEGNTKLIIFREGTNPPMRVLFTLRLTQVGVPHAEKAAKITRKIQQTTILSGGTRILPSTVRKKVHHIIADDYRWLLYPINDKYEDFSLKEFIVTLNIPP